MKIVNWVLKGSIGIFRISYLLAAVALILFAAYVLGGYLYLVIGVAGTDTGSVISMLVWIDKYFPNVPFWYPLAGGGVSITHTYPIFSLYIVSFLERITDLSLFQAFRVLGFGSVLLMAIGIYAFVALRFKNQTAALIASIFYLVSPLAWTWLFDWGFYAEAVSHMFVMPTIIFWDLFFTSFLDNTARVRNRIYLALTVIFLSLALLTHFGTGFGLVGFFTFYIAGYTIKAKERRRVFVRGILALSVVGVLALLLTAFTTLPFHQYTKVAAEGGLRWGGQSFEQVKLGEMPVAKVLGFQAYSKDDFLYASRNISFAAVVSFFAILGILLSFRSARLLTFALFAIFALTLSLNANFLFWILLHIPWPFGSSFGWRYTLIPLRMVLPTLAALGIVGLISLPFFWIKNKYLKVPIGIMVATVALAIAGFALYTAGDLRNLQLERPLGYKYGARGIDTRDIWGGGYEEGNFIGVDICPYGGFEDEVSQKEFEKKLPDYKRWCESPLGSHFPPIGVANWCGVEEKKGLKNLPEVCYPEKLTKNEVTTFWEGCKNDSNTSSICSRGYLSIEEQLAPQNWPQFTLVNRFDPNPSLSETLEKISEENPLARVDFSPQNSGLSMITPFYNLNRSLSQVHTYVPTTTLILRFQGRQQIAYYLNEPEYEDPDVINDFARWFGINYIFLNVQTDIERFLKGGWQEWGEGILKFPEENPLVDLSQKPSVLVISQKKLDAYGQVFELASFGALPYQDYFVVWGKENIDSYSRDELENFDVIILHGYNYKNQKNANELLNQYVNEGGRVFIDTGWQFTTPDWETEDALDIIPLEKLSWTQLGKTSDYLLEDETFSDNVDLSSFAPLIYQGNPWGVSTADINNLKSGANVILSAEGQPLIVSRELGKGRVVWSGMNIFPHARQKENIYKAEVRLLHNLFSWLSEGKNGGSFDVSYTRTHPDKTEFLINEAVPNGGFLLWKEAHHPDFYARLATKQPNNQTTELPVYRAGPGWALIKVPQVSAGDKIIYEYKKPLSETASEATSFFILVFFLPLLIVEGFRRERSVFVKVSSWLEERLYFLFFELWKKPLGWWGKGGENE